MNCKDCIHNEVCYRREACNDIEEHIRKLGCMDFIARADVQEIKHGEWIMTCNGDYYYCSECLNYKKTIDREFFYCPHCGAKMDGGNNNA